MSTSSTSFQPDEIVFEKDNNGGAQYTVEQIADRKFKVTGIGQGTGKLTFKGRYYGDEGYPLTTSCSINVKARATGMTMDAEEMRLFAESSGILNVTAAPEGSVLPSDIVWESSNPAVATVTSNGTRGQIEALKAGTSIITAKASDSTGTLKASCVVTVPLALTRLRLTPSTSSIQPGETVTLTVMPTPSNASLPDDLTLAVTEGEGSVVSLAMNVDGKSASITAVGLGTATITATGTIADNPNSPFTATCTVNVAIKPTKVSITSVPAPLLLAPGDTAALAATVEPAGALQSVTWESGNESVVKVVADGDSTASLTAIGVGKTTIYAASADGCVVGHCQVTVERRQGSVSLSRTRLVLTDGTPDTVKATLSTPDATLTYVLKDAVTYEVINWTAKLDISDTSPAVDGVRSIVVTPKPGSDGQYVLRVSSSDNAVGNAWAECRIDIFTTPQEGEPFYPEYRLDPAAVTVSQRQALNVTIAQFGLWPNVDASHQSSLMSDGIKIRFKGGDTNPYNDFFTFVPSDENTVDVQLKTVTSIAKKYQGELEVILPNGDEVVVSGRLTITVNDKTPNLKAATVTVNTFYDDRTTGLKIIGGTVEQVRVAGNNKLTWAGLIADTTPTDIKIVVDDLPSKGSGTLKLEAQLAEWGDAWYPVSAKVKREYTPPAIKLASTKVNLYMDATRATDNILTLQPRKSSDTLANLGITEIEVDSSKADAFDVRNASFNVRTGKFAVQADRSKAESALKGTLPLLVSVEGASKYKVKLNASVSLVKSNTIIKLKASKSAVTLNPNLAIGESLDIALSTNVAGFDLTSWHGKYPIDVLVYDSKDKGRTNINGAVKKIAAEVSDDGTMLNVAVAKDADYGKTYKVQLTLPDVNTKSGKPTAATLTLTVKTTKQEKFAAASISVKGKVDLSTGAKATITAKLTNYNNGINGVPEFEITPPRSVSANIWDSSTPEYSNFLFRRISDKSWTVELAPNGSLATGSYKIAIKNGDINGTDSVSTKAIKLTVNASKPKVMLSTKKVTLYNNDPGSRGVVTLSLPGNCAGIRDVTLKGAKLPNSADNTNFAYTIRKLDSDTYAILLDQNKEPNVLEKVKKGASVTLEVWLEGNTSSKPVATVGMTVVVSK